MSKVTVQIKGKNNTVQKLHKILLDNRLRVWFVGVDLAYSNNICIIELGKTIRLKLKSFFCDFGIRHYCFKRMEGLFKKFKFYGYSIGL